MARGVDFKDFASKFQEAAAHVIREFDDAARARLEELTDTDGPDGKRRLRSVTVVVGGKEHEVTLLQLMSPKRLTPDRMKIRFKTTVSIDGDGVRMTGHCGLLKKGVDLDVEMEFRADDQLEAVELVRERLNRDLAAMLETAVEVNPKE